MNGEKKGKMGNMDDENPKEKVGERESQRVDKWASVRTDGRRIKRARPQYRLGKFPFLAKDGGTDRRTDGQTDQLNLFDM